MTVSDNFDGHWSMVSRQIVYNIHNGHKPLGWWCICFSTHCQDELWLLWVNFEQKYICIYRPSLHGNNYIESHVIYICSLLVPIGPSTGPHPPPKPMRTKPYYPIGPLLVRLPIALPSRPPHHHHHPHPHQSFRRPTSPQNKNNTNIRLWRPEGVARHTPSGGVSDSPG